jgi:hypothetical protein
MTTATDYATPLKALGVEAVRDPSGRYRFNHATLSIPSLDMDGTHTADDVVAFVRAFIDASNRGTTP